MTRTPHAPGTTEAHTYAEGDPVRVRAGVSGGVTPGDQGIVHAVRPPGSERPVRVTFQGDPEPRDFEPDELEPAAAADR